MSFTAWCTCALFAVAAAHVYTRCELADELTSLGIRKEDVATWVCIAFHESRLDTAAQNHGSGDHGLLQISEIYWCGPGKACGMSCAELRDENIADDVRCALQIHEEHTRLQGDGFLAWVVYPQHCRHNVKKYLVDCDGTPKSIDKSRSDFVFGKTNETQFDEVKTPYLKIKSVFRSGYHNLDFIQNNDTSPYRWLDFKVPDIDSLKLPVFEKIQNPSITLKSFQPPTTKTYTTTIKSTHTASTTAYSVFTTKHTPKVYSATERLDYDAFPVKNSFVSFIDESKPTTTGSRFTVPTTKPTNKFTRLSSENVFTNKPTISSKYSYATPRTTYKATNDNYAFNRKSFEGYTAKPKVTATRYPLTSITARTNYGLTTKKNLNNFNERATSRSRNTTAVSYFGTTPRFSGFSYKSPQFQATPIVSQYAAKSSSISAPTSTTKFNIFDFYRSFPTSSTNSFASLSRHRRRASAFNTMPSLKF